MDSALTPRDIQARIRAGESLDEVAAAAGVPAESIEGFAAPVLAEREHLAGLAQGAPVRRKGEPTSQGALGTVVAMALLRAGVDSDTVGWDAWREPDRHWMVQATWAQDEEQQIALFGFDPRSRYSVARNDLGRTLIGEQQTPPPAPKTTRDPDTEPTVDLNDQLAIVRAIRPDPQTSTPAASVEVVAESVQYRGAELEEVDGVYDIVPNQSELDVLYEMLSSFAEDSVNIYAGLNQTTVDELIASDTPPEQARNEQGQNDQGQHDQGRPTGAAAELFAAQGIFDHDSESADPDAAEPTRRIARSSRRTAADQDAAAAKPAGTQKSTASKPPKAEPVPAPKQTRSAQPAPLEPEQDPLVETDDPTPAAKPRGRKKGRASVPSWDEIMFGGPKKS